MKKFNSIVMMVLMVLATLSVVATDCDGGACDSQPANTEEIPLAVCDVWVEGFEVGNDQIPAEVFKRGEDIEIKVRLSADSEILDLMGLDEIQDAIVTAEIVGYDHGLINDATDYFDIKPDKRYRETLMLSLPNDFDPGEAKLIVTVKARNFRTKEYYVSLDVETDKHNVDIIDVILDPADEVIAGRGLLARARVKNMGDREEDVKVTVEIPALGVRVSEYLDELKEDDAETSEDMFLRIPTWADEGLYVVKVTATYDDGYEKVTEETSIEVVGDEVTPPGEDDNVDDSDKTIVTVPGKQEVAQGGSGAVYPLMISNTGKTAKTYTLSVSGVDTWATYRVDPGAVVVVDPRKTETVYVYVTANDDAAVGEKVFVVDVSTSSESKQIPLTANVVEGTGSNGGLGTDFGKIKQGLEIGLIVLVVLLVILGLIIGFNKLKGDDDDETGGQTYY